MAKTKAAAKHAMPPLDRPVEAYWAEYKQQPSEDIRNILIEHYLPQVKSVAQRIHARLPNEVDIDDLMSVGVFGLIDAIRGFDLDRRVTFETYCGQRIRGAILDELRAMDRAPRLVRSRSAKLEKARRNLEMQFGRKPTDEELSKELDVSEDEYAKIKRDASVSRVVSLSRKWFETDSNKDVREDARQVNPFAHVSRRDLKDMITRGLSRAERLIIVLYYDEQMTMKEIGVTLDLSESRVSQMHSSILARLKARLSGRRDILDESS